MRPAWCCLAILTAAVLATGAPPARAGGSGYFGSYAGLGTFIAAASFEGEPESAVTKIHPGQEFSVIFVSNPVNALSRLGNWNVSVQLTFNDSVVEPLPTVNPINLTGLLLASATAGEVNAAVSVPASDPFGFHYFGGHLPLKVKVLDELPAAAELRVHIHAEVTDPSGALCTSDTDLVVPIVDYGLDVYTLRTSPHGSYVEPGDEIEWRISASPGADVKSFTVESALPDAKIGTLVPGSAFPAAAEKGGKLVWTFGKLKFSQYVDVKFRVKLANPLPPKLDAVSNKSTAKAATKSKSFTGTIPVARSRPDAHVVSGAATLGDGIYNTSGAKQTAKQNVAQGLTASWVIVLENDGVAPDEFQVEGAGALSKKGVVAYDVRYFDAESGGAEITDAVVAHTWKTGVLRPGTQRRIRIEVGVATARNSATFAVVLRSTDEAKKADTVKVKIRALSAN